MTEYLTLVFRQPINDEARAILEKAEWSAASHSHAIRDARELRNELRELCGERDELLVTIIAAASLALHGTAAKRLLDDAIAKATVNPAPEDKP